MERHGVVLRSALTFINGGGGVARILDVQTAIAAASMFTRSRLRRLAASVLVLWLFALASGIVNACVLGSDWRHATHEAAASTGPHVHHGAMAMDEADAAPVHGHQSGDGKPPCERLCDAPAAARAPDNELSSVLAGFWLAPAPLPSISTRSIESPRAAAPAVEQRWRAAVPLPIAFLRLTL